jgi:hypothetical protein
MSSDDDSAEAAPPTLYTTTMVLHYGTMTMPSKLTTVPNLPNGNSDSTISTNDGATASGIMIVAGVIDTNPKYLKCDDMSLASFTERESIWNTGQAGLFPEESDMIGHQSHHYHFDDCLKGLNSKEKQEMTEAERKVLCKRSDGKWKHDMCMVSGGSADCHACQMSIKGAIPGATIIP